ncbi:MAG: tRNA 2-thiouridine(34) synthase MnmA [Chloroflexota bacterium]|nr:tRNA 2-thiouridine(34) synthase MnmA [Chloroflexota bacterium]
MSKGKVVVAMSGGVDSSVAALLLMEEGYEVVGVTMKLYDLDGDRLSPTYRGCCTADDAEDARRVCHRLGVPHYVFNMQEQFRAFVMDYFVREYQRGRTPNPCLACNEKLKFSFLLQRALMLDAEYVATGHYARIAPNGHGLPPLRGGGRRLLKGLDASKDQSYVLYTLGQAELAHTLLPVGWHAKEEVRRLARQAGLSNADKPDSQEICFIPSGDYRQFLAQRLEQRPGDIVDSQGNVLGRHGGVHAFTVGQRKGLGLSAARPLFVTRIDAERDLVVVGPEEELYAEAIVASRVRYVSGRPPEGPVVVAAKIRYRTAEAAAVLHPQGERAVLRFGQPQRAVAPGQAVVFYQGEDVLGGGTIEEAMPSPSVGVSIGSD